MTFRDKIVYVTSLTVGLGALGYAAGAAYAGYKISYQEAVLAGTIFLGSIGALVGYGISETEPLKPRKS